jgi:hypothetical protein
MENFQMTDTTTETALTIADQLNILVIFDELNTINSLGNEAATLIRALVVERDEAVKEKQRQALATIAVEGQAMDNYERAEAAESRVKVLEDALQPFASRATRYDPDTGDSDLQDWCQKSPLTLIGDLRRARTALKGE